MTQQLILEPLGIVTAPNELGQLPAGAFSVANNVYMRFPGSIQMAGFPAFFTGVTVTSGTPLFLREIIPSKTVTIRYLLAIYNASGNWSVSWIDEADDLIDFTAALNPSGVGQQTPNLQGRIYFVGVNDRTIMNANRGHLVWDYPVPASSAEATPRLAGLPPPQLGASWFQTNQATVTGALGPGRAYHAVAILRRTLPDGSEIISAPATAIYVYNISTTVGCNITYQFLSLNSSFAKAGDVIEIYRTPSQPYSLAGSAGSVNTGAQYFLSTTYTINSTEATNGFVSSIVDTTPDTGLGKSLYTNDGLAGPFGPALPPPSSKCIANYKGHTFYGNITLVPQFQVSCPVYFASMPSTAPAYVRSAGIGGRLVTGDTSAGSAVLTNVSAANLVGVKVGQYVDSSVAGSIPTGARVLSIGATSITFDLTASSPLVATTINLVDVIEINGSSFPIRNLDRLAETMHISGADVTYLLCVDRSYPQDAGPSSLEPTFTVPSKTITFTRLVPSAQVTAMAVRATNGDNYVPKLPEFTATARTFSETAQPGFHAWSEKNQPENCPITNNESVSSGELFGYAETRDALFIWCSDGLKRLSGTGGAVGQLGYDWRVDPVDTRLFPAGPQAWCVHKDVIYAYTNRGFVSIDSAGKIEELSEDIIGDVMPGAYWPSWNTPNYAPGNAVFVVADEANDEIYIYIDSATASSWLFNLRTRRYTKVDIAQSATPTHATFLRSLAQMRWGGSISSGGSIYGVGGLASQARLVYQPIYSENPFAMRHFQQLNVSAETLVDGATIEALFNGLTAGTRTTVDFGGSGNRRASWAVPRNAPAIANNLTIELRINSSQTVINLQGASVDFVDLTSQRRKR